MDLSIHNPNGLGISNRPIQIKIDDKIFNNASFHFVHNYMSAGGN